ncbi:MAG: c-type cytochrome domain-containing protein [Luteolibacter sp.]
MKKEIDLDKKKGRKTSRPWGLVVIGLLLIGALVAMPFIAGEPDGEKMPDIVRFLGRFHPVVLHLPIGIFSLVLLQEMWGLVSRKYPGAGLLAVFAGAASAVVAVLCGFLLYQGGGFEGELVEDHLWGGIAFACVAVAAFIAKWWANSRGSTQLPYAMLLIASVVVMGYASHDGASITHGPTYLTKYAPNPVRKVMGLELNVKAEPKKAQPLSEQVVYAQIIQPIFDRRCVECHGADKVKGKLRMDSFELVMKGGKEGSGIDPGEALDSNIIFRAELPADDEEHMPPEGKNDIKDHELLIVKWWIDQGADPEATVADLKPTGEILAAIGNLEGGIPLNTTKVSPAKIDEVSELLSEVMVLAEKFPGALSYDAKTGGQIAFDGVKLRNNLDDKNFAELEPVLGEIVTMDLSATAVTDQSMALLVKAEKLRVLRLSETAITDATMDIVAKLENLESVNLYGTAVTAEGLGKLAALPNLKALYLWGTEVSGEELAKLREELQGVEILDGV